MAEKLNPQETRLATLRLPSAEPADVCGTSVNSPNPEKIHRQRTTSLNEHQNVIQPQEPGSTNTLGGASDELSSLESTPTHLSRPGESILAHSRALSRSSSVPDTVHSSTPKIRPNHGMKPFPSAAAKTSTGVGSRHSCSSVKHLTCFWWKEKGSCRFSDDQCLYAHYDTGHYTDPPRQLIPGEPALAGRKLDRAMRNLAVTAHQSSMSLGSMAGSRHNSRPSTPLLPVEHGTASAGNLSSPISSPLAVPSHYSADFSIARLSSDNQFLRTLVDQSGKEKAVMITTIENLQNDNKAMKAELEGLRNAQGQLLVEREGLHQRIQQMEEEQSRMPGLNRGASNPFGAIGRGRVNTETRFLGDLLSEK